MLVSTFTFRVTGTCVHCHRNNQTKTVAKSQKMNSLNVQIRRQNDRKGVDCSLRIYPYETYQLTPFNFSKSFRRISVQSRVFRHPRTYKQTRVSTCCPSTKIARDAGKIHMHDPRARLRSSSSYNKSNKTKVCSCFPESEMFGIS